MGTLSKLGDLTSESIDNSQEYAKYSWDYYKLKLFLHTSELSISIVNFGIWTILGLIMLLLLSVSLAFYLGSVLENIALGFLCVGLLYFLLLIVAFLMRRKVESLVINKLTSTIFDDE